MTRFDNALIAARRHANDEYPRESCGLIVGGKYVACVNKAAPPESHEDGNDDCGCQLCAFRIDAKVYREHVGRIEAVVHSHPNGPAHPSKADMAAQIATALPWIILPLNETHMGAPVIWGGTERLPLIGREFVHGVTDCYDLIRDAYAIGRDGMAAQGIACDWPFGPIELPAYARADGWWVGEDNFYEVEPFKIGFKEITLSEARAGDIFLCKIRSDRLNHGGVLLGDTILHHLPGRLSRREPAGLWARQAGRWIRYVGEDQA